MKDIEQQAEDEKIDFEPNKSVKGATARKLIMKEIIISVPNY